MKINKEMLELMDNRIDEAIKLLTENDYIVTKWTKKMNDDADECVAMDEIGNCKDCSTCSCNMCLMQ